MAEPTIVCHLGRVAYAPAWTLQEWIMQRLLDGRRAARQLPHVILLLEHPPVYTLGKSGNPRNLLLDDDALRARGAEFHRIDRGGDITFHGPGQLVAYFLLDLERYYRDLHRYMRDLEEIVILTCADFGLDARRIAGRTGVWIGPDATGAERKICALGIRTSRWITMHGLALNVDTDLSFFDEIIPCGIMDRDVTSMVRECGKPCDQASVRRSIVRHYEDVFGAAATMLGQEQSFPFLEELVGRTNIHALLTLAGADGTVSHIYP